MTNPAPSRHSASMVLYSAEAVADARYRPRADAAVDRAVSFDRVYEEHVDFVWSVLRRLGVPDSSIDDAAQDVFVVVHRRLADFEGRSLLRTWLYGIALRVAREHRRRRRASEPLTEEVASALAGPEEDSERAEALRLLDAILATMDDSKREAFVLSEVAGLSLREIAETTGVNQNTVCSRLRAARRELDEAVRRHVARDGRRLPR